MRVISYVGVLLLVLGCGPDDAAETTTTTDQTSTTSQGTTTTAFATDMSLPEQFPSDLLEEIVADAARHSGVAVSEIEVTSIEAMTYNDAALGCPEPGKMYAQVLTPGFMVLLDADGVRLDYRATEDGGTFRLCE